MPHMMFIEFILCWTPWTPWQHQHHPVSITLWMSLWPGLKLRDTADRITLIWPPLITWRKWTCWLTQLMGVTMVQPGLDCMMMWTAGDGHWKTMISIRKEREISGTGIMNRTTLMGMNCVFSWILMETGSILHVNLISYLSAMMVRHCKYFFFLLMKSKFLNCSVLVFHKHKFLGENENIIFHSVIFSKVFSVFIK